MIHDECDLRAMKMYRQELYQSLIYPERETKNSNPDTAPAPTPMLWRRRLGRTLIRWGTLLSDETFPVNA